MQNIPIGTSKNAQDVFGTCLVLSVNCVHILASSHEKKLMTCRLAENRIIINYFNMAVYANYEFVANTTKGEEEGGEGVVSIG